MTMMIMTMMPTPTPTLAPATAAPPLPTWDRTTTRTRGRGRQQCPWHQTPPLWATAHREEGWCVWGRNENGGVRVQHPTLLLWAFAHRGDWVLMAMSPPYLQWQRGGLTSYNQGQWQQQHPPPPLRATACRVDMGCWGDNMIGDTGWGMVDVMKGLLWCDKGYHSTTQWGEPAWCGKEGGYHDRATCLLHVAIYFAFSFVVIFVSSTKEYILLHKQ